MNGNRYVLVTAACNEERYIARTIESVVSQTVLPKIWVIVSDGSVDNTDGIVQAYSQQHRFIRLLRISGDHPRNFAAQAEAINRGWNSLQDAGYDFIGNLDADVSFEPTYFSDLLGRFRDDPRLGLAGGCIKEDGLSGHYIQTDMTSVPHTTQFFRRQCFEQLGGYRPLIFGGSDTCACVMARMNGWKVRLFPDLIVYHRRPLSSAGGVLEGRIREGRMDYSLGYLPAFELARCLRRIKQAPRVVGSFVRCAGFWSSYIQFRERLVTREYISFSRREQWRKLYATLRGANSLSESE